MSQFSHKSNHNKLLSSALESLTFSFNGTRFVGQTEPTPIMRWLLTESPFIVAIDDDEESGQIKIPLEETSSYLLISWGFDVETGEDHEVNAYYRYCLS
ncbi:hypothetical protein [Crocosphaera sp. Alani8]|uniref:hypothetical protein n=1 Tax=Crocosphaera sp. Alani8 TaxID=3038952 RepID=UPI00313E33E8